MFSIVNSIRRWQRRHAMIESLSRLDDRLLNDIGMTRADIEKAARRVR